LESACQDLLFCSHRVLFERMRFVHRALAARPQVPKTRNEGQKRLAFAGHGMNTGPNGKRQTYWSVRID